MSTAVALLGDGLGLVLVALLLASKGVAGHPELGHAALGRHEPGLDLGQRVPLGERRAAVSQPIEREVVLLDGQQRFERAHRPDVNGAGTRAATRPRGNPSAGSDRGV